MTGTLQGVSNKHCLLSFFSLLKGANLNISQYKFRNLLNITLLASWFNNSQQNPISVCQVYFLSYIYKKKSALSNTSENMYLKEQTKRL